MTTTTRRQGLPTFYSLIASQPVESNIKNNKLRQLRDLINGRDTLQTGKIHKKAKLYMQERYIVIAD